MKKVKWPHPNNHMWMIRFVWRFFYTKAEAVAHMKERKYKEEIIKVTIRPAPKRRKVK